jgi:hypothetical protein
MLIRAVDYILCSECGLGFMASAQIILWAIENDVAGSDLTRIEVFLIVAFENDPAENELIHLGGIVGHMVKSGYKHLSRLYDETVSNHLVSSFEDQFPEERLFVDLCTESSVRARFKDLIRELAEEYGAQDLSNVVYTVSDCFDIDRKIWDYFGYQDEDANREFDKPREQNRFWVDRSSDEVDDLFARD